MAVRKSAARISESQAKSAGRPLDKIETVATKAAMAAGAIHLSRLKKISIVEKSNALDLVTEADKEAEAAVIEVIRRAFPSHGIVAEESSPIGAASEHQWII